MCTNTLFELDDSAIISHAMIWRILSWYRIHLEIGKMDVKSGVTTHLSL